MTTSEGPSAASSPRTIDGYTIHPDIPDIETVREAFEALSADDPAEWGKMNAPQMAEHIARFNEIYLGRLKVGGFIGLLARLFGKIFVRKFLASDPYGMKRGIGTMPAIRIDEPVDAAAFEAARARVLETFEEIEAKSGTWAHPLYGPIPAEAARALARTHAAHHLRQFGRL